MPTESLLSQKQQSQYKMYQGSEYETHGQRQSQLSVHPEYIQTKKNSIGKCQNSKKGSVYTRDPVVKFPMFHDTAANVHCCSQTPYARQPLFIIEII